MFAIGFRIGNRFQLQGSWRRRITGPATVVVPIPPPIAIPGCRPGDEPPPLPSEGWLRGAARTWNGYKGNVVLVDAWASWCPYCHVMASDIKAIGRRYASKGVVVLNITSDARSTADAFCAKHHVSGPVLCNAESFLKSWSADHYPMLVVIGRDGRIVWNDGGARLSHRIDELGRTLCEVLDNVCD
ncbi:MAG TPA: TlpA disulfide reductase family protein [Pirellulales bacterium]|nr:TlpA disulfide reductase family protein [Pirellulales bacterium]